MFQLYLSIATNPVEGTLKCKIPSTKKSQPYIHIVILVALVEAKNVSLNIKIIGCILVTWMLVISKD